MASKNAGSFAFDTTLSVFVEDSASYTVITTNTSSVNGSNTILSPFSAYISVTPANTLSVVCPTVEVLNPKRLNT